jgi:hypothetical protein
VPERATPTMNGAGGPAERPPPRMRPKIRIAAKCAMATSGRPKSPRISSST